MSSEQLHSVDLQSYLNLFSALAGASVRIGILDADDQVLVAAPEFAVEDVQLRVALRDHLKRVYADVAFAPMDSAKLSKAQLARLGDEIKPLVELLINEVQLLTDMDAMTDELTNRYEDLNLVFDNQEVATGLVDLNGALEQLVENAASHLEAGLVTLIFPERDIEIVRERGVDTIVDSAQLRTLCRGPLWSYIRRTDATLVLNSDPADDEMQLCARHQAKLLVAPVRFSGGDVMGVLLLAKPLASANFSNGDRRIADVLCQNAQSVMASHFDALTGLMLRLSFEQKLGERLRLDRHRALPHALLYINVDRTQVINDSFGRGAGDLLLKQVGKQIVHNVRRADLVARLGGDEFAVLLHDASMEDAQRVADTLCSAVSNIALKLDEGQPHISISIGVTPVDPSARVDALMSQGQLACEKAREDGGGKVFIFDSADALLMVRHEQSQLVNTIQASLAQDRFELYCQPIVALAADSEALHFEVLLRMLDAQGDIISPDSFLPLAERYYLLPQIDRWVVRNVLRQLDESSFLVVAPNAVCAINLSGQSLSDEQFLEFVLEATSKTTVRPENLCFEITETAAIKDFALAQAFIDELKARGFKFSLDDFGTGLSSFTYLQQMPVDYLKIDGSFVSKITTDPISRAMVKAIADVADAMQVSTVGEYVEDAAICDALRALGITYGQGYFFSKPVPMQRYFAACLDGSEPSPGQPVVPVVER
ncbi:MAG: putative bifunctional diguanylate cyclase/phosphodiesterase [Pseudomonadales bacterium]